MVRKFEKGDTVSWFYGVRVSNFSSRKHQKMKTYGYGYMDVSIEDFEKWARDL